MSTVQDQTPTENPAISRQMQESLREIMRIGLRKQPIWNQLDDILKVVTRLPWLQARARGAIFIANNREELVLAVEKGMPEAARRQCAKVAFGRCACGQAARERQVVFRSHREKDALVDQGSQSGQVQLGHFSIPLLGPEDTLLGVMVLYVDKGHVPCPTETAFLETLGAALSGILVTQNLQMKAEINHLRFQKAQRDVTEKLVLASEYRDNETGNHLRRMSKYSRIIGKHAGLTEHELDILEGAAPMHDIGKVGIPDSIMLKPGSLTEDEVAVMRTHTTIGAQLLQGDHELIQAGHDIALSHHEHWDGSGYPQGLQGIEIPLFGRICAIADVYDALTTSRPYKKAWSRERALDLIESLAGSQFDPELVKAFMKGLWEILAVQARYCETGEEGHLELPVETEQTEDPLITWDENLSMGHEQIDNQHRFLIDRINLVHRAVVTHDVRGVMQSLMDSRAYAAIHFRDEEKLMERSGYPELSTHRRLHEIFVNKIEQFIQEIQEQPLATSGDLVLYMRDWVLHHIRVVDAGYAEYLESPRDTHVIFD